MPWQEEAARLLDEWLAPPPREASLIDYIEDVLRSSLWSGQRQIVEAVEAHPRVAVRSCHAIGKSFVAARLAIAYLQTRPDSIVITTAPTQRQVQNVLWRYIRGAARSARGRLRARAGHPLQTTWEITPTWYAIGFKAGDQNLDAFQGFHAESVLVIVDEGAGVADPVYDAIESVLTGAGSRLLVLGNPTSTSGTFYEAFHGAREAWATLTIDAAQTPNLSTYGIDRQAMEDGSWRSRIEGREMPYPGLIDPYWIDRQVRVHGPDSAFVRSRVWAEFIDGGETTLIPLSLIEAAAWREDAVGDEVCAGVDVARYGSDETVIYLRRGPVVVAYDAWRGASLVESQGRIQAFLARHDAQEAEVRVDEIGIGAGLVDHLRASGYRVVPINWAAASSDRERWPNLRHEAWWQLAERFRERRIAWPGEIDEMTMAQLADIRYSYRAGYTMPVIEDKEAMRRRGRRSPDRAEALAMAFLTLPRPTPTPLPIVSAAARVKRRGS